MKNINLKNKTLDLILKNYLLKKDSIEYIYKTKKINFEEFTKEMKNLLIDTKKMVIQEFNSNNSITEKNMKSLQNLYLDIGQLWYFLRNEEVIQEYKENLYKLNNNKEVNKQELEKLKKETAIKILENKKEIIKFFKENNMKEIIKNFEEFEIYELIKYNLQKENLNEQVDSKRRQFLKTGIGIIATIGGVSLGTAGYKLFEKGKEVWNEIYPLNPELFNSSKENFTKENFEIDKMILTNYKNIIKLNNEYALIFPENKKNIKLINQRIKTDINIFLDIYKQKNPNLTQEIENFRKKIQNFVDENKNIKNKDKNIQENKNILKKIYKQKILILLKSLEIQLSEIKNKNALENGLSAEIEILENSYKKLFNNKELVILKNTKYFKEINSNNEYTIYNM